MDVLHIKWLLYYWRCLFSVLELDVRYKWWIMYPNTHCSLFSISHFWVYTVVLKTHTCIKLENFRSYVDVEHIEQLLYYRMHSLCGLQLHERSYWRESYGSRHPSVNLWNNIVCVYLQACTFITIWYTTTPDNKTHLPYDCILHTKRRLYCQRCNLVLEQSWLATLHIAVSSHLIVYVMRYYRTSLWVCCQTPGKGTQTRGKFFL